MREDDESIIHMTKEDAMSMYFVTLGDAEKFYKDYTHVHGFGIRMDRILKNRHGQLTAQLMVCSAEGSTNVKHIDQPERQREHRPLT